MRNQLILGSILFASVSFCQSSEYIDWNNAKAPISDNGLFFHDPTGNGMGYEIPKGNATSTLYTMSLWLTALDDSNNIHAACNKYDNAYDMFPGPIANDYYSTYYQNEFGTSIWKVTQDEIDFHIANYSNFGYVTPPAILNWPGNGNTSEGVAQDLAPYVDVNNNGFYDPPFGDYPEILGDQAVYVIMNDERDTHEVTGSMPMSVEIHCMFYQFNSNDDINNTTFLNVKIYNRGNKNFHDFRLAMYCDFDIGYYHDDYVGCDSIRNFIFGYNGTINDPGGGGQSGYGTNPPAFGALSLNHPMTSSLYFNNSGQNNGDPNGVNEIYNYCRSRWRNGQHVLYGGNGYNSGVIPVWANYMFAGNPMDSTGWTEYSSGNSPDDRRMLLSTDSLDLPSQDELCYDFAFIFSDEGGDHIANVGTLKNTADFVQDFYNNQIQSCGINYLGVKEEKIDGIIYPNPSTGTIFLDFEGQFTAQLYDLNGKLLISDQFNEFGTMNLDLENGIYLLKISSDRGTVTKKVQIIS